MTTSNIIDIIFIIILLLILAANLLRKRKRSCKSQMIDIKYKCDTSALDEALNKLTLIQELQIKHKPISIDHKSIDELIRVVENTINQELIIKHHPCSKWSVEIEGTAFKVETCRTLRAGIEEILLRVTDKGISAEK